MEINLLRYFTFTRFLNVLKILLSYNISRVIRKPVVWGMPLTYSIEPTNHCNLKCPECPSGLGTLTRPLGLMKPEFFKKIIDEIDSTGFYVQLFFQGEPYINKNLPEMIEYAQEKNIYISVSTNGHFINEHNAGLFLGPAPDKIIFSIDGIDETTYQNYRIGGTFKAADEGLKLLTDAKKKKKLKKPFIELQFIVMKQNEHLIDKVKQYGISRGVDRTVFKTMQISSYSNAVDFLPQNEVFRRYSIDNGSFKIKGKLNNHCFALWRTSVITWDGRVVPCCFDKDAVYEFGRLNGTAFNQIWNSGGYQNFRQRVLINRKETDMCSNCTAGIKVNIFGAEQ
jgi:radical SAM protein with 4Fe4S-binding SPASM domain